MASEKADHAQAAMSLLREQGKAAEDLSVCSKPVASCELFFEFGIAAL